jgi:hypothetical protein
VRSPAGTAKTVWFGQKLINIKRLVVPVYSDETADIRSVLAGLATVAKSGQYSDLIGAPSSPSLGAAPVVSGTIKTLADINSGDTTFTWDYTNDPNSPIGVINLVGWTVAYQYAPNQITGGVITAFDGMTGIVTITPWQGDITHIPAGADVEFFAPLVNQPALNNIVQFGTSAPTDYLVGYPFYFDTTATTGGLYVQTGSFVTPAWVRVSTNA